MDRLWEVLDSAGRVIPVTRMASFVDEPVVLSQDNDSADVTADLVDVGQGTSEQDYTGKYRTGAGALLISQPVKIDNRNR